VWAIKTLVTVTLVVCFVSWHGWCCWRILLFVDKSRCVIQIKGSKAQESKEEIRQILERYWFENLRLVRDTKGAGAYLRLVGSKQEVRYPLHWKRDRRPGSQQRPSTVALSPQSPLYQQIVKLAHATWDSSQVGVGYDGIGLSHNKIVVRQISVCQNDQLFQKYDVNRKIMCMDASVNRYAPVTRLHDEPEIATRKHIRGNGIYLRRMQKSMTLFYFNTQHVIHFTHNFSLVFFPSPSLRFLPFFLPFTSFSFLFTFPLSP